MELLLNLVWLLLALPAYQLWCRSRTAKPGRSTPMQCLFALACALVVLFPVVSATDDLHAIRAEIEESPASKRSVRHSGDRGSGWTSKLQSPPALPVASPLLIPPAEGSEQVALSSDSFCSSAPAMHLSGRAPPSAALA